MRNDNSGEVHGSVVQARRIDMLVVNNHGPVTPTALEGLPPVSGTFAGRLPELAELSAGTGTTVVHGLGGVGKTELVRRYAHREKARFPGGFLVLDLQGHDPRRRVDASQALLRFLRRLGLTDAVIPPEESERSALFRSEMAKRETMLVILDNASESDQVKPLLVDRHRIVVTSRKILNSLGSSLVPLGMLAPGEALELVGDPEIVELCGRLPLALRIMAAMIKSEPTTDWAAELREARLDVLDDGDSDAVIATFSLSYRFLDPEQRRMFRLLALHPGDQVFPDSAAALADLSPFRAGRLMRELRWAHLLTEDNRFHDLVRLYSARCLEAEPEDGAVERVIQFYRRTAAEHAKGILNEHCAPDAVAWMDRHHKAVLEVATTAHHHDLGADVVDIAEAMFRYFSLRKHMADWYALQRMAVDSATRLVDRRSLAKAFNRLATIHRQTREFAHAIEYGERSVGLSEELDDRIGVGAALIVLGATYREMGRADLALACCERSLGIRREVHDPRGLGISLANMGETCLVLGRADEAAAHFREALVVHREWGHEGGEAITLHGLGKAHHATGRLDLALDHYAASLEVHRRRDDRFGTAITLVSLGSAYADLDRADEANETYREALELYEAFGDEYRAQEVRERLGP